jgi:hypothetical protein
VSITPTERGDRNSFFFSINLKISNINKVRSFRNMPEEKTVNKAANTENKEGQVTQDIGLSPDKPETPDSNAAANPGDRIDPNATIQEKARQVAVDAPDITGDHIKVPTYFVVEEPDGEEKALHHVKDAEEISDVIRQARTDEEGNRTWW